MASICPSIAEAWRGAPQPTQEAPRSIPMPGSMAYTCAEESKKAEAAGRVSVLKKAQDMGVLAGRDLPESLQMLPDNSIKTTKYTAVTFLPKNLWEQFHKFGNVYFALISVLMYLGEHTSLFIGTIKAFSTAATLMVMMAVTSVMALIDDRRRGATDRRINNQTVEYVERKGKGSLSKKRWQDVLVGDVLKIYAGQEIPADVALVYSAGESGKCFVSTANLDGETNLKPKIVVKELQDKLQPHATVEDELYQKVAELKGSVEVEPPNDKIYALDGNIALWSAQAENEGTMKDAQFLGIGPDQVLLRGTVLRNTPWCLGIVIYTGAETRMVQNSRAAPIKYSNLERVINKVMVIVLLSQGLLALISDILFLLHKDQYRSYWYLVPPELLLPDCIGYWLTFFVLYSNLMPISLYPSMEICNVAQSYFIKNDAQMYWRFPGVDENAPVEERTFPASVGSSNLCQELGQIKYIFSDKTGTLTQNVMEFKRCSIGSKGIPYGDLLAGEPCNVGQDINADRRNASSNKEQVEQIDKFLEVLALCHTAMPKTAGAGGPKLEFEGESPDEIALVQAAAELGWTFTGRNGRTASVDIKVLTSGARSENEQFDERQAAYEVLAVNEFDSTRKKMSVFIKRGNDYLVLSKGADNVMLKDPPKNDQQRRVYENLEAHLKEFSEQGLRTLVLGHSKLDGDYARGWLEKYEDALTKFGAEKKALLSALAAELEGKAEIVGATGIEDMLQDQVPETIEKIRQAGIKLWVLTGDKLETAKNIGFSAQVLVPEPEMTILELSEGEHPPGPLRESDIRNKLDEMLSQVGKGPARRHGPIVPPVAVLVTGAALEVIFADSEMKPTFKDIAQRCSIVMACRVSPNQKALMVRLIRDNGDLEPPVTLAIGDGANDVPMIQEAQVGVGIAGREGRQAVNNSDFAIGQFQYLQRLLLLHGRWNYRRVCKFVLFTFWRNAVQVLMIFYYTTVSGFSGTSLFEDWIRLSFNFLCSLPIIATGCFDQDVNEQNALKHAYLYSVGRDGLDLNNGKMLQNLISAVTHSNILLWLTMMAFPGMELLGAGDYYTFGTAVYSCLIIDMNYRVLFLNFTHNRYTVGVVVISFLLYAVYLVMYPCFKLISDILAPNMYMVPAHLINCGPFQICAFAVPLLAMVVDVNILQMFNLCSRRHKEIVAMRKQQDDGGWCGGWSPFLFEWNKSSNFQVLVEDDYPGIDRSDLAQQRLTGLGMNHGPWGVCSFGVGVAVILFFLGSWVESGTEKNQVQIHYEGQRRPTSWWLHDSWNVDEDEIVDKTRHCHVGKECTFSFKLNTTLKPPILMYYALGPYYQNFNDYLKSEVAKELMGKEGLDHLREQRCPKSTRVIGEGEDAMDIVPCGMKATSFFNDTFSVKVNGKGINIDKSKVGWPSDLERYHNIPDHPGNDDDRLSMLWERYPDIEGLKEEGVNNRQFVEWMRPGALWRVRKRYGEILEVTLNKGDTIEFTIDSQYPSPTKGGKVDNGYKHLVLTEMGRFGGRHPGFGKMLQYMAVACATISLLAFFVRMLLECIPKSWRTDCPRSCRNRLQLQGCPVDESVCPLMWSDQSDIENPGGASPLLFQEQGVTPRSDRPL